MMPSWLTSGLEDNIRSRMFACVRRDEPFSLATIVSADGGPRPAGAQMVINHDEAWGFLSGGCIEADVTLHAREALKDGKPRHLIYGRGSPFVDIRLPCGGRLEVFVERVSADDKAVVALEQFTNARQSAFFASDGNRRWCTRTAPEVGGPVMQYVRHFDPLQRFVVVGSDPFALAMAGLGRQIGWETVLLAPFGPSATAPFSLKCDRRALSISLPELVPDRQTAIAVATHESSQDQLALVPALSSDAGYVGVLGSRRKLDERIATLIDAGLTEQEINRLHAPIGLDIGAQNPWEVAVAVIAEITSKWRSNATPAILRTATSDVAG